MFHSLMCFNGLLQRSNFTMNSKFLYLIPDDIDNYAISEGEFLDENSIFAGRDFHMFSDINCSDQRRSSDWTQTADHFQSSE
jgi:hypothetical protein